MGVLLKGVLDTVHSQPPYCPPVHARPLEGLSFMQLRKSHWTEAPTALHRPTNTHINSRLMSPISRRDCILSVKHRDVRGLEENASVHLKKYIQSTYCVFTSCVDPVLFVRQKKASIFCVSECVCVHNVFWVFFASAHVLCVS